MKELLLSLILYVIQNNTNTIVTFNTYDEYELRTKEKDRSLERQGLIYVQNTFNEIKFRDNRSFTLPDINETAWKLIWSHTRPDLDYTSILDYSILKRIHPSDKYCGSSRKDQIGDPSVNPFTKEIYPVKDKALVITKPTINPIKSTRTAP
jgi:hypothetical protein